MFDFLKEFKASLSSCKNYSICLIIFTIFLCNNAYSKEKNVNTIITTGVARLGIHTNYFVISSEKFYSNIAIPREINIGDILTIEYENKIINLWVGCLEYREHDNLCWAYERCRTLGNMLYIQPCKPIK